ncbi:MAG: hypothetical protein JST26_01105 [Bacteroidetes bacterium]|nr:hypothetical protein [Bacteroidota bacterium]
MLQTLKMSLSKHILMIQRPGILYLDLLSQLKKSGYTTSYFASMLNIRDMVKTHVPDLIILETEALKHENSAKYLQKQNHGPFGKIITEALILKNDILVLDKQLTIVGAYSKPFDSNMVINALRAYFQQEEKALTLT